MCNMLYVKFFKLNANNEKVCVWPQILWLTERKPSWKVSLFFSVKIPLHFLKHAWWVCFITSTDIHHLAIHDHEWLMGMWIFVLKGWLGVISTCGPLHHDLEPKPPQKLFCPWSNIIKSRAYLEGGVWLTVMVQRTLGWNYSEPPL